MFMLQGRLPSAARILLIAFLVVIGLTGCGGSHRAQHYTVTLPTGKVVTQAHSPALAAPKPGVVVPEAIAPVASVTPSKTPVSHLARVLLPHRVGTQARVAGFISVATVEQFDSTTINTIPRGVYYVAGYVDGFWRTYWQLRGHYPVTVGISVAQKDGADCFDMEPGNPGPSSAGPWAKWQMTQGNPRPCEYSMLSWMPAIKANLKAWGVKLCSAVVLTLCVRLWDADWTYAQHLDTGYFCTQWTDHAYNLNLDESTCLTSFYVAPKLPRVKVRCFGNGARVHKTVCSGIWARVTRLRREKATDHALILALRQKLVDDGCRGVAVDGGVLPGWRAGSSYCKALAKRGDVVHARVWAIDRFIKRALVARY